MSPARAKSAPVVVAVVVDAVGTVVVAEVGAVVDTVAVEEIVTDLLQRPGASNGRLGSESCLSACSRSGRFPAPPWPSGCRHAHKITQTSTKISANVSSK